MNIFLKLLLCLLAFLSQSVYSYQYDAGYNVFSNESVEYEGKNFGYDGSINYYVCCENHQNEEVQAKTQDGSFFALVGILDVTKGETTVVGRVKDLQNLKQGEKSLLDRLPDQGSPKANWKQNSGVLRQEMGKGQPIRDASPGDTAGQFLNAERNLLKDRGWAFDSKPNYWNPPAQ